MRRKVFVAALGQFEELLNASAVAGPASRPLPLYYALNQVGRAIIAAHQAAGQPWEPRLHGLTARMSERGDLQTVIIAPQRNAEEKGMIQLLSQALGMPTLATETTVAQIWAAISGLPSPGLGASCPRPIFLETTFLVSDSVPRIVMHLERPYAPVPTMSAEPVEKLLRDVFPRAANGLVIHVVEEDRERVERTLALIAWQAPDGRPIHLWERAHSYLGDWWLVPRIGDETLSPFMLWWTLLLALSTIARYHPAEWTAALDPDEEWTTVPIERVLDLGLAVVPRLALEALARENPTV